MIGTLDTEIENLELETTEKLRKLRDEQRIMSMASGSASSRNELFNAFGLGTTPANG